MQCIEIAANHRKSEYDKVSAEYESWKAKGLKLNMARGKPGKKQLELSNSLLTVLSDPADCIVSGVDARNYGELKGLESARALFAELLGCKVSQVFVGGNASLQLMYDTVSKAYTHGLLHSEKPWCKEENIKWLCPAPGYDRHFKITESFGFELITIPMTENGPDMDIVENLIRDPSVKGMWNVPKYSNPDGIIYSDETIERIAKMKPAAPDFLLMWDNAYCIHEFDGDFVPFPDILSECEKYGNADMVFEFASTSKVTLPGAGISCFACSEANMDYMTKLIGIQAISFDKMNQLRHVKFLKNKEHRPGSKHRADIAVTYVLIEKRRSLLEQLRAAIVQAQRIFAVCAVGIDRFGLVPNGLQQGAIVNVFQKLVDLRFRVADLRTLAEQRGQRFFQLSYSAHGNSSNHFSDAAFSGQEGYAPQ